MSPRAQKTPREEIVLSIGGVVAHLELAGAQPVFMEQLRARYGAFEMPAAPWVVRGCFPGDSQRLPHEHFPSLTRCSGNTR